MKKRLVALGLAVCTIFSLVGCGKEGNEKETTTAGETVNVVLAEEGKLTMPSYKELVAYAEDVKVSEEDLQKYLNERLDAFAETEYIKEGTIEKDMSVKLSYVGTIDGKEFSGGSSPAKVVKMTEKGFAVEGFTAGLIGHKVGDTVELDLKFADDYSDTNLKGKAVHYSVKIDSIVQVNTPKLSDEYIKEEYGALGMETVEQFMEYLREQLYLNNVYQEIWPTIVENTKVEAFDKKEYEELFKTVSEGEEYVIYSNYGYTLDQYLSLLGMTQADWDLQISEYVKSNLKEEMIINEIAKIEKLEPTQEEYDKKMLEYAKSYGLDSAEELKEQYGAEDESYWFSVKTYKVQKFVVDNAKIKEGSNPEKETTTTTK